MTKQNNKPEVGKIYEGKVIKMLNFGAFVEIMPGVDGLVHISNMAPVRIAQPEDILEIGAIIDVKCIEVTDETLRLTMLDVEQLNEKVFNRIRRAVMKGDAPAPKRDDRKPRGKYNDKPRRGGERKFGNKPRGNFGDKPRGDRPRRDGDKPRGDRKFGDKPRGEKKDFKGKPRRNNDDRPRKSFSDKPKRSFKK